MNLHITACVHLENKENIATMKSHQIIHVLRGHANTVPVYQLPTLICISVSVREDMRDKIVTQKYLNNLVLVSQHHAKMAVLVSAAWQPQDICVYV